LLKPKPEYYSAATPAAYKTFELSDI